MTMPAVVDRPASKRPHWRGLLARVAVTAPDRLLAVLFWASLVVSVALLFGVFRPYIVLPAILVLVVATWRAMPSRLAPTQANVVSSLCAQLFAVGWVGINLPFASEYLVVDRDPGFLTLAGVWLTTHSTADIALSPEVLAVIDAVAPLSAPSPGSYQYGDVLYTQGADLLPGLLAIGGWVGGVQAVMAANLLIGGVAILSVYSLSRRVVGPWWSLLPTVGLGLTVPFAAFTRAGYTEPVTLALVFGGLVFVWDGISRRHVPRIALGAAIIGSAALARIDGAAPVIGVVIALGVAAAVPLAARVRRSQLRAFAYATALALAMVGLGYLDLRLHSPLYLNDLESQFRLLIGALAAAVIGALLVNAIGIWPGVRRLVLRHRRALGGAVAGVVVVLAIVLASRPLWYEAHHNPVGSPVAGFVGALQAAQGLPISPTRSYDEYSITWQAWYLGWPCVILGFAGLAFAGYRAVAARDARYLMLLAVFGLPSLMYFWQVNITADQIWSMRRFLPITFPALLVCAAISAAALWSWRHQVVRIAAITLAIACIVFPMRTWADLFTGIAQGGRYSQIQRICDAVDGRAAILYNAGSLVSSIRTICDVDVLAATEELSTEEIARASEAWGEDVAVVAYDPSLIPWVADKIPPITVTAEISDWERTLMRRPASAPITIEQMWIGLARKDGTVDPVPPATVVD